MRQPNLGQVPLRLGLRYWNYPDSAVNIPSSKNGGCLKNFMVPPYDEKDNEGLERWLWQVQKYSTNFVPYITLCKNLAKHTSAFIFRRVVFGTTGADVSQANISILSSYHVSFGKGYLAPHWRYPGAYMGESLYTHGAALWRRHKPARAELHIALPSFFDTHGILTSARIASGVRDLT